MDEVAKSGKPVPRGLPYKKSYIPAQYNKESELTVEVKARDENHFDFALDGKK